MTEFDCRQDLTKEVFKFIKKRHRVAIYGDDDSGKTTLIREVLAKLSSSDINMLIIDLSLKKAKPPAKEEIAFCLKHPDSFSLNEKPRRNTQISEGELMNQFEYVKKGVLFVIDNIDRVSPGVVELVKPFCKQKRAFFLVSTSSMKNKNVQALISNRFTFIRKLFPVNNKILKELFDKIFDGLENKLGWHYDSMKKMAVSGSNGKPGLLFKIADELKDSINEEEDEVLAENTAKEVISKLQEHINQVTRRVIYVKPWAIVLPITGFGVAFCMARSDMGVVHTVTGIIFAGICLSTYRILVGWAGRT